MKSADWADIFADAVQRETLFRAILSRSLASGTIQKVTVRPIRLRDGVHYQWTARVGPQERHENLTREELVRRVGQQFGVAWGDLHWFADDGDYTARWKPAGKPVLKRKPPSHTASIEGHNRARHYILPEGQPCPFLIAAGLMTPSGQVKPTSSHKFRQINRYLEFIADIVPQLPAEGVIRVVDFGCGKSSLTFALHHFLTAIHHRTVDIVGLDRKAEVIEACRAAAQKLNCQGLRFEIGDIAGYQPEGTVHLAISLHACDTATDDALATAIRWQSSVIFAVPCCQHELNHRWSGALPGLTDYGLLKDRFAAMATDALRARLLDCHGYRTQIVEFIEMEHTPKNVLIRAVKFAGSTQELAAAKSVYDSLKQDLGVITWHLETVLNERPIVTT